MERLEFGGHARMRKREQKCGGEYSRAQVGKRRISHSDTLFISYLNYKIGEKQKEKHFFFQDSVRLR